MPIPGTHSVFAFPWLLPLTQIALCIVVVWPLRATLTYEIKDSVQAYRPQKALPRKPPEDNEPHIVVFDLSPQERRSLEALERREWVPMVMNLPSGLLQVPYAALKTPKQEWVPRGMDFKTWRVISWPLIGILFWWSAGRGRRGINYS